MSPAISCPLYEDDCVRQSIQELIRQSAQELIKKNYSKIIYMLNAEVESNTFSQWFLVLLGFFCLFVCFVVFLLVCGFRGFFEVSNII